LQRLSHYRIDNPVKIDNHNHHNFVGFQYHPIHQVSVVASKMKKIHDTAVENAKG